ncbi:MAG TPA: cytochrome c maturation protein CcmE [Vicinamibacteria bacterium]|nr:cytochrome c maturation protein CcmE [Vicinamibacteria bacterium]
MSETVHEGVPAARAGARRGKWFAIGAVVVAAAALGVLMWGGIGSNLVYYWGPTELHAAGDKAVGATIRLGGLVAPGSVQRPARGSGVEFDVIDRQGGRVHVRSSGVPPQMFRESIGVVVEGTMTRAGHFDSNRLMVSHSNEYRVPGEDPRVDVKTLMKTTSGLEAEAAAK